MGCEKTISSQAGIGAIGEEHLMMTSKAKNISETESELDDDEEEVTGDETVIETDDKKEEVNDKGKLEGPKVQHPSTSKEICKFLKRGICKHRFSGTKAHDGKAACGWYHPKICTKLFKFGLYHEKGCRGAKDGRSDFHPKLCNEAIKGN